MAERNEEAGGGGGIGEAGRGVWNGREFRIHLQGRKFDDVQVTVARKKELMIAERGSGNLIVRSKLPRTASTHFTHFMENGFLVVSFDRVSFGKKIWNVLVGGATLAAAIFGCVSDAEATDRGRQPN